jgi:hypothetical protein
MSTIDTSPSNNGRGSEAWHLRVELPELDATVPLEEYLERADVSPDC